MKKTLAIILILCMCIGAVVAICLVGCAPKEEEEFTSIVVDENGKDLTAEENPLPKQMVFAYTGALKAVTGSTPIGTATVSAVVKPESATNKNVAWSVSFANPDSAWASGKNVADYVTIETETEGSATATIKCWQAFGEQIKLTASPFAAPACSSTCNIDFLSKVLTASFHESYGNTSAITVQSAGIFNMQIYVAWTVGTVKATWTPDRFCGQTASDTLQAITNTSVPSTFCSRSEISSNAENTIWSGNIQLPDIMNYCTASTEADRNTWLNAVVQNDAGEITITWNWKCNYEGIELSSGVAQIDLHFDTSSFEILPNDIELGGDVVINPDAPQESETTLYGTVTFSGDFYDVYGGNSADSTDNLIENWPNGALEIEYAYIKIVPSGADYRWTTSGIPTATGALELISGSGRYDNFVFKVNGDGTITAEGDD